MSLPFKSEFLHFVRRGPDIMSASTLNLEVEVDDRT